MTLEIQNQILLLAFHERTLNNLKNLHEAVKESGVLKDKEDFYVEEIKFAENFIKRMQAALEASQLSSDDIIVQKRREQITDTLTEKK